MKLARVATGRPAIIAFRGGFHGRTAQTMALTSSRVTIRGDFEPLPGSVYHAAYPVLLPGRRRPARPVRLHLRLGARSSSCSSRRWSTRRRWPAMIIEPVIGEGGYIVPPPGLPAAAARDRDAPRHPADRRRGADGLRPDRRASGPVEHWNVRPTSLVMAKGIASGLPLSGIMAPPRAARALGARRARRHVRRQRRQLCRRQRDARRDRATRGWWRSRGARPQLLDGSAPRGRASRASATCAASGCMVALEFVQPGAAMPRTPNPDLAKRVLGRGPASAS